MGKKIVLLGLIFVINFILFICIWNIWIGPFLFKENVEALSIVAGLICGVIFLGHYLWFVNHILYPTVTKYEKEFY